MKLTGYLRYKICLEWLKRGRPGDKEDFVKKVCAVKGWQYQPPRTHSAA